MLGRVALLAVVLGCGEEPRTECVDAGTEPVDYFARLGDPSLPARAPIGVAHLASSRSPEDPSGRNNQDWAHFQAVEDGRGVLLDARGPGVVTRFWATQRSRTAAPAVEEDIQIRIEIDGREVLAVGLRELTSGSVTGFPRPWVAGPDSASGSLLVAVPIHFQDSIRVTAEIREGFDIYYMIDWRELPCGTSVRSFDGAPTPEELGHLEEATLTWVDGDRGELAVDRTAQALAPGESLEVSTAGPAIIHTVTVAAIGGLDVLEAELVVDGDVVASAPAHLWLMATSPAEPYASALSRFDGARAELAYPIRVDDSASLVVTNRGPDSLDVEASLMHAEGSTGALGRFHVDCTDTISLEEINVRLSEIEGRGHLAGQFLVMDANAWGFTMLEGDPEIFVDGRALLGTGVEDFFGGAHYFIYGPFAHPTQGAPGVDASDPGRPRVAMYRHMLLDAVGFETRARFEYEAFDPGTRFRACTYWYLE